MRGINRARRILNEAWWFARPGIAGLRDWRTIRRMLPGDLPRDGSPVPVRLRPLGGRTVWMRPGTSDAGAVWDTFVGCYHRPPEELGSRTVSLILDLGSNIGTTIADLAVRYPTAEIRGVELDGHNAEMARRNTAHWAHRCTVLQAAVWDAEGTVRFVQEAGNEHGTHVVEDPVEGTGARAVTIDSLLKPGEIVDYLKMDIEGAEARVLAVAAGWTGRVRTMKVEVHSPYTVDRCVADLNSLGFVARAYVRHHAAVSAFNPRLTGKA